MGHCADPGCYSRSINYNASSKQIKSLAELSAECHQAIKVRVISQLNLNEYHNDFVFFSSMIVITPLFNLTNLTPGGTIEMEMRNISGPEIIRTEFTPASAELMGIVSILR